MKRGRNASIPSHSCPSNPQSGLLQGGAAFQLWRCKAGFALGHPLDEERAASTQRLLDLFLWRCHQLQSLGASKHHCIHVQAVLAPLGFCVKGSCCSVRIGIQRFYVYREPAGWESFFVCGPKYQKYVKCRCAAQLEVGAGRWSHRAASLGLPAHQGQSSTRLPAATAELSM